MVLKKLFLQVDTPSLEEEQPGFARPDATASVSVQSFNGELKLVSNSFQEYKFTAQGLHRTAKQRPMSAGRYYQISEKDVLFLDPLGEGASSMVYKGYLQRENCYVAVKRIDCLEKEKRRQILNDIRGLCDVSHPALVQFIGAYRTPDSGQVSIVLEYMDGGSLADLVQKVGKVPEEVLSCITAQVLHGLVYLHKIRHTVHRDIKPANILLSTAGVAKIADFGISAFVDNTLAVCNTFLGTVTYMSPERINSQPYSFAADIWSIGLSLLECALGKYPYDATAGPLVLMMQVLNDSVPLPEAGPCSQELRDFVQLCLHKDPFRRPPAEKLLCHPFILKHNNQGLCLRDCILASAELAKDRSREQEDREAAKDQAIALQNAAEALRSDAEALIGKHFTALSAGSREIDALADDFAIDAVLVHEGLPTKGRLAILQRLRRTCDLQAALGASQMVVDSTETQCMQGGALVLVTGHIDVTAVGPLGSALWGQSQIAKFAQAFELSRQPNSNLIISRSFFRHL